VSGTSANASWLPPDLQVSTREKKSGPNNENANDGPLRTQNGTSTQSTFPPNGDITSRRTASNDNLHPLKTTRSNDEGFLSPLYDSPNELVKGGVSSGAESLVDPFSTGLSGRDAKSGSDKRAPKDGKSEGAPEGGMDDSSKWIHRDKLARIESEELQAAGIILPRQRYPSKTRRDYRGNDVSNGSRKTSDPPPMSTDQARAARSRKNSEAEGKPQDIQIPMWDLRLPDEIIAEANGGFQTPNGLSKGGTKIPVAKLSPVPLPLDYLERESPSVRKPLDSAEGDGLAYPKPRSRSASMKATDSPWLAFPAKRSATDSLSPSKRPATENNTSPKKASGTTRKASTKGAPGGGRPKTRSGPNKDSTSSSGTRPSTRSGELSTGPSKHPEGDPPWMISAYTPDPRLPPDQQLLPTVARRLQQERWEKEGKFGNVYDKEFRPLNDDPFLQPPEPAHTAPGEEERQADEWPLKTEPQRSPGLKIANSYSTMPKIQDKPPMSPVPSPRTPVHHGHNGHNGHHGYHGPQVQPMSPLSPQDIVRMPEPQESEPQKKGCGCCIVM
jgi:hypothetical protein